LQASGSGGSGGGSPGQARRRPLLVGWLLDGQHPGFVYQGPRPISGLAPVDPDPDRLPPYPAVGSSESHYFEVPCPFDLRLRPASGPQGRVGLINTAEPSRTVSQQYLSSFAVLMERDLWRHPERPVVQVVTPYRFLADETVWLAQLPAFSLYRKEPWPGIFVGGRLPIHIWPRLMSWAFEWHDPGRELVLNAGEPWYYIKLESEDPTRPVAMVEAAMTPELRTFCQGLDGVIHFANRTFSLFETAKQRRPARLLQQVEGRQDAAAADAPEPRDAEPPAPPSSQPDPGEAPPGEARRRALEVGWLLDAQLATFLYEAPRPIGKKGPPPASAKALPLCPAILDYEKRYHEILCPFDLRLKLGTDREGRVGLINAAGAQSAVSPQYLGQIVGLLDSRRWARPERPVLQVATAYRFLADEPVWMEQLPPFHHLGREGWPGLVVGGRIPIHLWPRKLVWTFEWHERDRELVLKRGEPWFYVNFEGDDPTRHIRLVQAEMSAPLKAYCQGLDNATEYTARTDALLETARRRRPATLLSKAAR